MRPGRFIQLNIDVVVVLADQVPVIAHTVLERAFQGHGLGVESPARELRQHVRDLICQ